MAVEVAVTSALSNLAQTHDETGALLPNSTSGLVETRGVGVCRGLYGPRLTRAWRAWDEANGSENDPVDAFPDSQLYVVFVFADGGVDLERVLLRSAAQARSVLVQTALTLAVAEEGCEFEHRDLHWGNVLVAPTKDATSTFRLRGVAVHVPLCGVRVTLIDFTLSRLRTRAGTLAFCDLAADPELFQGPRGDEQAETYRRMRAAARNCWEGFHPKSNALWMRYLAEICARHKMEGRALQQTRGELRSFARRAAACCDAREVVWDEYCRAGWTAVE